jgi:hypothetical protein
MSDGLNLTALPSFTLGNTGLLRPAEWSTTHPTERLSIAATWRAVSNTSPTALWTVESVSDALN